MNDNGEEFGELKQRDVEGRVHLFQRKKVTPGHGQTIVLFVQKPDEPCELLTIEGRYLEDLYEGLVNQTISEITAYRPDYHNPIGDDEPCVENVTRRIIANQPSG